MIKIKGEGTSLDWQIINGIKDVSVKNIEFKNITFECETITDASGNLFEKRVKGKWITPTEKIYSMDGEDITPAYKECNRCHKVYVRTNDNFCPNCGADMREDMRGEA